MGNNPHPVRVGIELAKKIIVTSENNLTVMDPILASEFSKTNSISSDEVYYKSAQKYIWECSQCSHVWSATVKNRLHGSGCPTSYCLSIKRQKRLTESHFSNSLQSRYPQLTSSFDTNRNGITPDLVYPLRSDKFWWLCERNHSYQKSIHSALSSKHCPECRNLIFTTDSNGIEYETYGRLSSVAYEDSIAARYPELAKRFHSDSPFKPDQITIMSNRKILIICENHVEPWETCAESLLVGRECVYCLGKSVLPGFNDFATIYPELAKQFTVDSPNDATEVTIGSTKTITVQCPDCGYKRKTKPRNFRNKNCGVCSNKILVEGINDLATTHPKVAALVSPKSIISAKEITYGSSQILDFKCTDCNFTWSAAPKTVAKGYGCRKCTKKGSYLERIAFDTVADITDLSILRNKKPITTEENRKLEIDIYLPELNLAFEVQDFATHSRDSDEEELSGLFLSVALKKSLSIYKKGPTYHKRKIELAKSQLDVDLYEIWEDEIRDGSFVSKVSEIISSRVAKLALV